MPSHFVALSDLHLGYDNSILNDHSSQEHLAIDFAEVATKHPEITRFAPGIFSATNRIANDYAIHHWSSRWWPNSFKRLNEGKS